MVEKISSFLPHARTNVMVDVRGGRVAMAVDNPPPSGKGPTWNTERVESLLQTTFKPFGVLAIYQMPVQPEAHQKAVKLGELGPACWSNLLVWLGP